MQFLTPQQKREKARRLFVGYGLFAILISLATYILISTALGYEVFSTRGEVIQNGLLVLDSKPDNADIFINGKQESSHTDAKLSLPEGKYDVSIKKNGYSEWRDNISLVGGNVRIISYPRLLPVEPVQLADIPYQTGKQFTAQSLDRRWLAVAQTESSRLVDIYDMDDPNAPAIVLSVPGAVTGDTGARTTAIVGWASDNRHLLIMAQVGEKQNYVLLDKDDSSSVTDLTQMFGLQSTDQAGFWDAKWDKLYIHHAAGTVMLASVKDKSVGTVPLVSEPVLDFYALNGERAVYSVAQGESDLNVKLFSGAKSYVATTIKRSQSPLLIKSGTFNRSEYVAIAGGSLEKTYVYRNLEQLVKRPTGSSVAPFVILPNKSSNVEFSQLNRFILASDGMTNVVYDIESKEVLKYATPAQTPSVTGWFDDARLYSLGNDRVLSIYDFNGSNLHRLISVAAGVPYVNKDVSHTAFFVPSTSSQSLRFLDIATASKQ